MKKKIESWGGTLNSISEFKCPSSSEEILKSIDPSLKVLPYGLGKSYGDTCLNSSGQIFSLKNISSVIDFDEERGIIDCQAGISLEKIQTLIMPKGWILPVISGTKFITLGGAIANDIHGKNHNLEGSFGNFIQEISLLKTDGILLRANSKQNSELFKATIGGIGLTGFIISAKIKLKKIKNNLLDINKKIFFSYDHFQELISLKSNSDYIVSSINCKLDNKFRGVLQFASHSEATFKKIKTKKTLNVPLPKVKIVNKTTKTIFNYFYFNRKFKFTKSNSVDTFENFTHPLDRIKNWNKFYGSKGFYQFQCRLPHYSASNTLRKILLEINKTNQVPFLPVLKVLKVSKKIGHLSFSEEGITFSVDFENRGKDTIKLYKKLSRLIVEAGGRLYLAKDCLMSKKDFEESYPEVRNFDLQRDKGISSSMSKRLLGY